MTNRFHRLILNFLPLLFLLAITNSSAQTTRKVLFLGNSYTNVNNLPQLVHDVALSAGDTLIFDSNMPGGYTTQDHSQDPASQGKIMAGGWDYVVIQGQSQEPITHTGQFRLGASDLETQIHQYNPCAVLLLYMTWGRKNGDPTNCQDFPVMCTYEGMDSTLRNIYLGLADLLNTEVSPVSVVWHHLRQNNPGIELYQPDESHPSKAGSYAAACSFYAAIFKKDPTGITYDYGLPSGDAATIRNAAKTEVFDHLNAWDYKQLPVSGFQYQIVSGSTNTVSFQPINYGAKQTYHWDFGDGDTSTMPGVIHSYATNGTYTIRLTTTNCDLQGVHHSSTDTVIQFCQHTPTVYTNHPWLCYHDTLWTQPADAYQWYSVGNPIPETRQFLPDYLRYINTGFSVRTTVNGCAELSKLFYANPEWPGYYFDSAYGGDPCEGDTALFMVLHFNGTLPDSTQIDWYKDGSLLPGTHNVDTLRITSQGTYWCTVVNPGSHCPVDTITSSSVTYDCGTLGLEPIRHDVGLKIYPNPASEHVTIDVPGALGTQQIQVYNATGQLMMLVEAASPVTLNVAGWPSGLYIVRAVNSQGRVVKFVKQ